ncbi:MAG: helix-turn-helix domain-containing protein [Gammaproteobacteria bacterium]|nr:helix-turn-helix domain-containing protein [Gammaproteobacteria bacterium]
MSKYHHLSLEERAFIMLERDRGSSLRQIASNLERSPSTLNGGIIRVALDSWIKADPLTQMPPTQ